MVEAEEFIEFRIDKKGSAKVRKNALEKVLDRLLDRQLGAALEAMENYQASYPDENVADQLQAITADYLMMTSYWRKGFKDPQLESLFDKLLQRTYVLWANQYTQQRRTTSAYLFSLYLKVRTAGRDWTMPIVEGELETIATELTMLELEPTAKTEEKRTQLNVRHHRLMSELFDYVVTSAQWSDGEGAGMERLLLSPTICSRDQQLMVSGLMMACVECFDIVKFRTLTHVYEQTDDENVRQRALVGWVLALNAEVVLSLYPEAVALVEHLLESDDCQQQLVALQRQMIYCMNAEEDHNIIQQEIMPDLLKNNSFRYNNGIIEEVEDDPLEDILHPDAVDRKLEAMENSFSRMTEMRQHGSDIYFGGFSQMKRYPFFDEMCNWFVPFYADHPGIRDMFNTKKKDATWKNVMRDSPFCDSDRYSFLLALSEVVDKLPSEFRQLMNQEEIKLQLESNEDMQSPDYIRRAYLQDLYRFYRVFPRRSDFVNCFDTERRNYLFFAEPICQQTHIETHFNEMTAFLLKKKRYDDAADLLNNYGENRRDMQFYQMAAYVIQRGKDVRRTDGSKLTEIVCLREIEAQEPTNERMLAALGRALFEQKQYEQAIDYFDRLLTIRPEKRTYQLNKAVCLIRMQHYEEATKILYRLNYEAEDDPSVNRVLAWALTCDGRYEQAEKLYGQLLRQPHTEADDLLNYGYCLWFAGGIDEAADCFHRYLALTKQKATFILENEHKLISEKGITEPEMQMMLSIV